MVKAVVRRLEIPNETRELKRVRSFVSEVLHDSCMVPALENRILVAIDEAVANIIKHAYDEGRRGTIEIRVEVTPGRFQVAILDSGKHFNPDDIPDADVSENARTGRNHGLGVYLMRQIMDEVEYRFEEGIRNELRMVKYLDPGAGTEEDR